MLYDIIDNSKIKLVDVLKEKLSKSKRAKFCVGWLFLSGFKELRNEIDKLEKLEILAGPRTNKQTVELLLLEKKWEEAVLDILEKNKYLTEDERNNLLEEEFKSLMNDLSYIKPSEENIEFLKWFLEKLKEGKIEIRIYYKEPLHAKLYLFENKNNKIEAIVGSSNFSLSGFKLNTELNISISNKKQCDFLYGWFNNLWEESKLANFTELAIQAIEKCWAFNKDITPFRVYLKVLHEIFSYKEETKNIEIEVDLYDFQKDAVISAYNKLLKFNGVFIADVPGLGKTYIGSALLSHLETEGMSGIVICPPRLINQWEEVLSDLGVSKTKVFSSAKLDEILENEKYLKRKVVLIDESHHFRNPDTKKYRDMQKICQGKYVILLSATPQNLSIWDIYWQIKLFTPHETYHNFRTYPIKLKEYFEACEEKKANIEDLISQLFIRRTRTDIKTYYSSDKIVFPERKGPYRVDYSIENAYEGLYEEIKRLINQLKYARYDLSRYAIKEEFLKEYSEVEFTRLERAWENLQGLIKINLYRRLESSVEAFRDTIKKYLEINKYFYEVLINEEKVLIGELSDLEDIVEQLKNEEEVDWSLGENYYPTDYFDINNLKSDLKLDIENFHKMLERVNGITPDKDDKLQKLIDILNKEPIKNKKVIIFSYFESTVKYIYENLKDKFEKVDYISGGEKIFTKIKRFAPVANHVKINPSEEIQILVSTEVLSEGLNLQDGQVVINYDLHWNPVRIIQRIGRIDRIGSEHSEIYVYNFFPELKAEKELRIEELVRKRIDELINNFGYDQKTIGLDESFVRKKLFEIFTEKPEGLEEEEEKSSFNYFEFQFKKLINDYPEEYQKALELPAMVNIKKFSSNKGIIVFCRADDYYRLRFIDFEGNLISANDFEILKILECSINEKGEEFNKRYFNLLEKIRKDFEEEANNREEDKINIIDPVKEEFKRCIARLERGEPRKIKSKFRELLDFVLSKQLNYEQEKEIRKISREYPKKFGLKIENLLGQLENDLYEKLKDANEIQKIKIQKKYAQIIIAEELG